MIDPVNDLHAMLRQVTIPEAIAKVHADIEARGYDVVKADPGVQAWVMENRQLLEPIARLGGLR